jgi:hypothetical protein
VEEAATSDHRARTTITREGAGMNFQETFDDIDAKLKGFGITRVEADYSGYSDEFNGVEVNFFVNEQSVKDPAKLENEITTFLEELIETRHGGFWNNEGGNGQFIWNVGDELEHEHRDVIENYDISNYTGLGK